MTTHGAASLIMVNHIINVDNLSNTDDENPENVYGELYLSSGTLIEEVRTTDFSDKVLTIGIMKRPCI